MISIVICSRSHHMMEALTSNIAGTIGTPFEIIAIDNAENKYSICEAYNSGGDRANYPILCFMHEDVQFETMNWGKRVCDHLLDTKTGLLGFAGSDAKSSVPSSWSVPLVSKQINLIQHYKNRPGINEHIIEMSDPPGNRKRVVAVDGVWLCTRKEVFQEFRFDSETFTGFHGYDIDYSLQVNTRFEVYVIFDVVVHHYSEGSQNKEWVESAVLITEKWKGILPVFSCEASSDEISLHHWRTLQVYLKKLVELRYSVMLVFYNYFKYSFSPYFTVRRFLSMGKYVTLLYLGHKRAKKLRTSGASVEI